MDKWYLPLRHPQDINEATEYYVRTLERAGESLGLSLERVGSLRSIPRRGKTLVIECKTAFKLAMSRPRCPYWLWLQGVVPEEIELQRAGRFRKAYWTAFERVSIPRAQGALMVSRSMHRHYASKYGVSSLPVFVMPCVNKELDESAFAVPSKYVHPSFVYAGSLDSWQCFDLTLEVFRRVRSARPGATLTVLTAKQDAARALIAGKRLEGVTVDFVPLAGLPAALRSHKYGFVLREPHVVNAVATPTKVSSYMAAGVIPVMTSTIDDYRDHLGGLMCIVMSHSIDPDAIARDILAFEQRTISPPAILAEYRQVFRDYLDHSRYTSELAEFLRNTGLTRS